jgi:hypothetical protein
MKLNATCSFKRIRSLDNCRRPEGNEMSFLKSVTEITLRDQKRVLDIREKYSVMALQTGFQTTEINSSEHVEVLEADHIRDCKLRGFYRADEVGISPQCKHLF